MDSPTLSSTGFAIRNLRPSPVTALAATYQVPGMENSTLPTPSSKVVKVERYATAIRFSISREIDSSPLLLHQAELTCPQIAVLQ